ncbi:RNA polymerase sigma factor [Caenispirillum salinarum]|uniref:RNA polymerase sigma factor n=1 Tax=Caenispirillum salinarum TaxID=859058 RepID=UPI00384B7370
MSAHVAQGLTELLPRLRRFARGLTGSATDADDLVQAACERALRASDQYTEGTRLDSWLYRIVQTTWIDMARGARRRAAHLDSLPAEQIAAAAPDAPAALTLGAVRRAVAALPEDQRVLVMLVCVEGQTYRQAAEVLDLPIGTVMSRLSRGRATLRRLIEGETPGEDTGMADALRQSKETVG